MKITSYFNWNLNILLLLQLQFTSICRYTFH